MELERLLPGLPLAGDSALDKLTMLADNSFYMYAVCLSRWNASGGLERKSEVQIPVPMRHGYYDGLALIEIWVIDPPTVSIDGNIVVEPLHLALTYTDKKLEFDERASSETGHMLEKLGYEFEHRWA